MVNYGTILIPLYIYPLNNAWKPLTDAASQYPGVNFTAVINPDSGPDRSDCPNKDYIDAIAQLNALPNIETMGYVHTANRWNCGPTNDWICPASASIDTVKANITKYQNWPTKGCVGWSSVSNPDIHIDSLFIDEAPNQDNGANLTYMSDLTSFAKTGLVKASNRGKVLFNAGGATDARYFPIADTIVILENIQAFYESANITALTGDDKYYHKSSIIMYAHSTDAKIVRRDVQTILSCKQDNIPNLFITSLAQNQYASFGQNFTGFVAEVDRVIQLNKGWYASGACS